MTSGFSKKNPPAGAQLFPEFSQQLFKIRRTLLEQFNRMEGDLQNQFKQSSQIFASRADLDSVIERVGGLKDEVETLLHRFEAALDGGKIPSRQPASEPGDINPFFTGLTPFNLRRRYHEMSLNLRSDEVDMFGFDPVFESFVRPLFDFLFERYWRVETFGINNIPNKGPCLMVGNHSGSLPYDASMLKMALLREHPMRRELRFMVEDFLFHFPFLGSLMHRFGGVRASQENAERLLDAGMCTVVFPEGVKGLGKLYRDRYQLARFGRGGFIKLCLRTRAPLVPVAFIGPEEIHPMIYRETGFASLLRLPYIPVTWTFPWLGPLGLLPLPSKWSLHILPPIDFSEYGPGAEKDRVLVYKLSQQVKAQIQDTILSKLKERRSPWFD